MRVIIQPNAKKELKKFPRDIIGHILRKLYSIKDNPLTYIERLKGSHLWKLRVGDYRVILYLRTKSNEIHILKIGHRKNIYKRYF